MATIRPWVLLCKPVRAPFRDGTSVLVRNMLRRMPPEVELYYFGDPAAPVRTAGDQIVAATAMSYQPSLRDKVVMLAHMATPRLSKLPIHSFFAANKNSSRALDLLRRFPRRRPVLQTLPASTGAEALSDLFNRLDRVIVTSSWGREKLISAGVADSRVVRVYPGVELPDAAPGLPVQERRALLFAGDLDPDVGERLIAIARALEHIEGWRLEIATRPKGEDHARVLRKLEQTLGAARDAGRVKILGEVSSMNELFDAAAMQLYLATHARKKVDIPFVLLEGMARGVPVAIVDADPARELLSVASEQGLEIGLSLDPQRFADAADSIVAAIDDPARLASMGAAARRVVLERFSAAEMAASYGDHYRELS